MFDVCLKQLDRQASNTNLFEKKTHKDISFQYENFNRLVIPAEIDNFSNPLWEHSTKILFQSY